MNTKSKVMNLIAPSIIALSIIATGCAKEPIAGGGGITLKSAAFNAAPAALKYSDSSIAQAMNISGVNAFSFCITQLKLEAEDGSAITEGDDDGDGALEVKLGLVNAGDGSAPITWGTADLPAGTRLKRIKVEVHKDAELCAVEYSAKINDATIDKDLEFKFAFPAETILNEGDTITFDLSPIVEAMKAAYDAGHFTTEEIGAYIESIEAECDDDNS